MSVRRGFVASLVALAALGQPARAEGFPPANLRQLAETLVAEHWVEPGETVLLEPSALRWDAEEVAFLDGLSAALLALKVNVVRPSRSEADLRPKGLTRILDYTLLGSGNRLHLRSLDPATRQLRALEVMAVGPSSSGGTVIGDQPSLFSLVRLPDDCQALGGGYSSLAGSGLTYRRWWGNGWGFQVAGIPLWNTNAGTSNGTLNLGVQGMMPIVRFDRIRLFGLLGAGAAYTVSNYGGLSPNNYSTLNLNVAPGIGMDLMLISNLGVTAAVGYSLTRTTQDGTNPTWGLNLGGTIGALLYW